MSIDQLKKFFPNNFNGLYSKGSTIENIQNNSIKVENDVDLKRYFINNTKNLQLEIVGFAGGEAGTMASPYTVPAMIDPKLNELKMLMLGIPGLSPLYTLFITTRLLANANIDGSVNTKNNIIFSHNLPSDVNIFAVQPIEFKKAFPNVKHRFATMLHEIGHWHSFKEYGMMSIFDFIEIGIIVLIFITTNIGKLFLPVIAGIMVLSGLINSYVKSINEQNADKFTKKLGYGNELAHVLYNFGKRSAMTNLPDPSKVNKITMDFSDYFVDFFERILVGYPSITNRMRMLKEGESDNIYTFDYAQEFIDVEDIKSKLDFISMTSFETQFMQFCNKLDDLIILN